MQRTKKKTKKLWNMRVTLISTVVSALVTVTKSLAEQKIFFFYKIQNHVLFLQNSKR